MDFGAAPRRWTWCSISPSSSRASSNSSRRSWCNAAEECHKQGALLKVIFENAYLTDELKIVACRISARAEVDFVKTSTAFGPGGYTIDDLKLMRAHTPEHIGVKAAGGVRTLEKALEVYQVGCSRFGTTATAAILDEWKARLR